MILISCVDDGLGLRFNHRRQSRDKALAQHILRRTGGEIWLHPDSAKLFADWPDAVLHVISDPEEVPEGSEVIIRSHGESRAVHEGLHARGVRILDATCPNVTRIHQIVARAEEQGRQPIIIGTRDHPEVLAIAGWCCRPVVLSGAEELENWLAEDPSRRQMPLTFVSQTTAIRRVWDSCVKKAKKECTNAEFFDTICGATSKRQEEAVQLAAQCGAMVVIGDPPRANTTELGGRGRGVHLSS